MNKTELQEHGLRILRRRTPFRQMPRSNLRLVGAAKLPFPGEQLIYKWRRRPHAFYD